MHNIVSIFYSIIFFYDVKHKQSKKALYDVFNDVMLDSGNLILNNDFFASIAGDNNLIHASNDVMLVSNEINTLETELILNDSFACDSNANNDLSHENITNNTKKPFNANDVIIDF